MLRGGSNHHDGSNGIELYINDIWLLIYVCNDDMTVVGDGMPLRLHEWAVRIKNLRHRLSTKDADN